MRLRVRNECQCAFLSLTPGISTPRDCLRVIEQGRSHLEHPVLTAEMYDNNISQGET
jgi:hypothetical protein